MPRALAVVSSLVVCAVLAAGCNSKNAGDKPTVGFITNNPYEFWSIVERGTEKAAQDFNVKVEFKRPARGSQEEQRAIVEDLLAKGLDGLAVTPFDPENQVAFLDTVAARIPLITADSDLPKGSKRLCYIGTDNYTAGLAVGKMVSECLPDGGSVIIFVGTLDVQNAVERRQGVVDLLANKKGAEGPDLGHYKLIDTMTDDSRQEVCKSNAEDALVKYDGDPEKLCLVGLWAYNPPAILSAVQGAKLVGKVKIVGFDENEETLAGVSDGSIYGTVVQQPFETGYQAIRVLAGLARGDRTVLPEGGVLFIPHHEITRENVQEFWEKLKKIKAG